MYNKEEENESHVLEVEPGLKRIPQDTDRSAMGLEKLRSLTIEHQPPHAVSHWILLFRLPKPAHLALYVIIAQTSYPPDDHSFRSSYTRPLRTQRDGHIHRRATIPKVQFTPYDSVIPALHLFRMEQFFSFMPRRRLIRFTSPDGVTLSIADLG